MDKEKQTKKKKTEKGLNNAFTLVRMLAIRADKQ